MNENRGPSEARRQEDLWAGEFGEHYRARNRKAAEGRAIFWHDFMTKWPARRVLEVGCNNGANLRWITESADDVWGVDVSQAALDELSNRLPEVHPVIAPARRLPFDDSSFDLVFTAGVLIHQPESSLREVMSEMVRVSRRYVLSMEYAAQATLEVAYRGQRGALFKRDYRGLFQDFFPNLRLVDSGFLPAGSGWDDVTWWLFELSGADRS